MIGVILCGHDGREGIAKAKLAAFGKNAGGNAFWERRGFTTRPDLVYRENPLIEREEI